MHLSSRCPAVLTALWNSKFHYNLKQIIQKQLTFFSFLPNFFFFLTVKDTINAFFSCVPVNSRSLDSNLSDVFPPQRGLLLTHSNRATGRGKKQLQSAMMQRDALFWSDSHILGMQCSTSWATGVFCPLNWAEWCPETSKDLKRALYIYFSLLQGFLVWGRVWFYIARRTES